MANAADNPKWDEAMSGPYADGWLYDCFVECGMDANLEVFWAFRCIRFPNGALKKLKAHFCACGYDLYCS